MLLLIVCSLARCRIHSQCSVPLKLSHHESTTPPSGLHLHEQNKKGLLPRSVPPLAR
ncbi:hypothetical protein PVAP13_7NG358372 [Panicum virgatum]|uniref:Uncharacterized protein n=1 Tax=Panicum virgatum TaxID=38727 RepID=A0A8T0PY26_PANVG|nr:hypothetical protein PVAP13_7NG358372 [Panicum virgatum]